MCGIVGYIGKKRAKEILFDGLQRLEYRGYDSSGMAVYSNNSVNILRTKGRLDELAKIIYREDNDGHIGIAHTRWATHGRPSVSNAHPHKAGCITIVHNGIVENYLEIKNFLGADALNIASETDTEVVAYLILKYFKENKSTLTALVNAISHVKGSYAIVVLNELEPDKLFVAKKGSPIVMSHIEEESFIASDVQALVSHTKEYIVLEDEEFAVLSKDGIEVIDKNFTPIDKDICHVNWDARDIEKGGYKHFMLKEIFEQPIAFVDTIEGRIAPDFSKVNIVELEKLKANLKKCDRLYMVACGTAYYAGFVARYMIENIIGVPVEVELASEFRYKKNILSSNSLVVFISQSGETADTLAALKNIKKSGIKTISICNVRESSIARESDAVIYTHAGLEIGVASTKAFTSQMAALYLFMLNLGQEKKILNESEIKRLITEFVRIPTMMVSVLENSEEIKNIARRCRSFKDVLYIGRNINYPIALEAALKLKEISYLHAEGYAGGELKHGPIAIIDESVLLVAIVGDDKMSEKIISNILEVKARDAFICVITNMEKEIFEKQFDIVFKVPLTDPMLSPFLTILPLQLFAYFFADQMGLDIDKPRNLAKSVTVE